MSVRIGRTGIGSGLSALFASLHSIRRFADNEVVADGLFAPDGTFLPMPQLPLEPFLKLWEQRLFALPPSNPWKSCAHPRPRPEPEPLDSLGSLHTRRYCNSVEKSKFLSVRWPEGLQ